MEIAKKIQENEQAYYGTPEEDLPITAETLFDFPPQDNQHLNAKAELKNPFEQVGRPQVFQSIISDVLSDLSNEEQALADFEEQIENEVEVCVQTDPMLDTFTPKTHRQFGGSRVHDKEIQADFASFKRMSFHSDFKPSEKREIDETLESRSLVEQVQQLKENEVQKDLMVKQLMGQIDSLRQEVA